MVDDAKKAAVAEAADELLHNSAFNSAVLRLRKEWYQQLMDMEPQVGSEGYLTRIARHVSMLATLERIPVELAVIISNQKFDRANVDK